MTDKDLGTAAGDIFTKAFTLGYETGRKLIPAGGTALTAEEWANRITLADKQVAVSEAWEQGFEYGSGHKYGAEDDGVRLTAEQVEDVEALVATANPYSAPADRLRALFPATEPAAERCDAVSIYGDRCFKTFGHDDDHKVFNYTWDSTYPAPAEPAEGVKPVKFRKMTPKYATANFGFPDVTVDPFTPFTRWAYKDSDGDKWAWNGDQWELHVVPPAPAEPAEEETKAEEETALLCSHPMCRHTNWGGRNRKHLRFSDCPIVPVPASSPVVPAPTETGPKTWCAITGADSSPGGEHAYVTVRVPKEFVSGQSMADLAGAGKSRELARLLAPFVAAAEEG